MPLAAGTRLGHFEVIAPVASGGMGEVYRARDLDLRRDVALKVLPGEFAQDPGRLAGFEREARAAAALNHPNILVVFEVGTSSATPFVAFELLSGSTLRALMDRPLGVRRSLDYVTEIARGLAAAHDKGVVHRDVKPENLFVTTDGHVKILDFGIATLARAERDADDRSTVTLPGAVIGTAGYMAPEQVRGEEVDSRADVFALGAVFYEMLAGRRAFPGSSAPESLAAILKEEPPGIAIVNRAVPAGVARVVHRCLAKPRGERFQSARDIVFALEAVSEPVPPASSEARWHGRRAALVLGALGVAALTAGATSWMVRRNEPRPASAAVATRFVVPSGGEADAVVPVLSPDGRRMAYVAARPDGQTALYVHQFEVGEAHAVAAADALAFPFWSPDSRSIAFFSNRQLVKVEATGGPVQKVCEAIGGRGGTWNAAGVIVFAPTSEGPLWRVEAAGGRPTQLTVLAAGERSHRFPQFLRDSERFIYSVYYNTEGAKPAIDVGGLHGERPTRLVEGAFARAWAPPGFLVYAPENDGTYVAQSLDEAGLRLTGDTVPIAARVSGGAVGGESAISTSANGVLAFRSASRPLFELTWLDRSGRRIGAMGPPAPYRTFALSPEGRRVAVTRFTESGAFTDLWVIDAAGGGSRLTTDAHADTVVWAPAGDRVAFANDVPRTGNSDVWLADVNKPADSARPLHISDTNKAPTDWSRDGRVLLLTAQEPPGFNFNILSLALGGVAPVPFVRDAFNKYGARFSPDGRWVAYHSDGSGTRQVFVQSFPDGAVKLLASPGGGAQPRWRADGKELYYLAPDGTMMASPVIYGRVLAVGTPSPLFRHSNAFMPERSGWADYDVDASGRRFLVASLANPSFRGPVTVVMNWTANLRPER
jgi:eukaryotic-like serine/threonine-protein kinase